MKALLGILVVLMSASVSSATTSSRPTIQVGALRLGGLVDGDYEFGCGFSAFVPASKGVKGTLIATWGEDENLHVFLDGRVRLLKAHGDYAGWAKKLGEAETFEFGDTALGALIKVESTWVCPKNSSGCELAKYRGTLKLTYGAKSGEVAIHAAGGC